MAVPTGFEHVKLIYLPGVVILWRETDLVNGKVVRREHLTLDATTVTETILTQGEAVEVAEAILAAAR